MQTRILSALMIVSLAIGFVGRTKGEEPRSRNADQGLATLIRQLHDDDFDVARQAVETVVKRGNAVVEPLCEQLDRENDFFAGAQICYALGRIGDQQALPAMLRFINRDLDEEEKRQAEFGDFAPMLLAHGMSKPSHWYKNYVLPAVAGLGDESVIATLVRLRQWYDGTRESAASQELTEPVFAALKMKQSIPALMTSFIHGKAEGRSDEATDSLLAIGVPVGDYLIRDWQKLDRLERRRRMRMLVLLADEWRTGYMIGRQSPKVDVDRARAVLFLTEDDLRHLHVLADDADRHVRYHLARLLKKRLEFHKDDQASSRVLARLAGDDDPSVKSAAQNKDLSSPAYSPDLGPIPRRTLARPPDKFAAKAEPLKQKEISIQLSLERSDYGLDAPEYRFNDPIWLRLRILPSGPMLPRGDDKKTPRIDPLFGGPDEGDADLRNVRLVVWDAHGRKIHNVPLFRIGRDERCYILHNVNLLQYPKRVESDDFTLAYVNLIEAVQLAPGEYVMAAEFNRQLTGHVALTITSSASDRRPLRSNRMHFNPFGENPYAQVKWRTYLGGSSYPSPVVSGARSMFVAIGPRLVALNRDDGAIVWRFESTTGNLADARLIDGQLVVETIRRAAEEVDEWIVDSLSIDPVTGKPLAQRDIASYTKRYEKGGFQYHHEIRFGNGRRSYLVARDGTVALWSGTEILRRFETGSNGWLAASADGGLLYGCSKAKNVATCCDVANRKELWQTPDIFFGGMHRVGDVLYGTAPGYGPITALDARTGKLLWQFPEGANQGQSPAVDGCVVYAGSWQGSLWAIDASRGELLWRLGSRQAGIISRPAAADGVVYYLAEDGYFYAVENTYTAKN